MELIIILYNPVCKYTAAGFERRPDAEIAWGEVGVQKRNLGIHVITDHRLLEAHFGVFHDADVGGLAAGSGGGGYPMK